MSKLLILSSNPRRDLNLDREVSDLTTAIQRLGQFEIGLALGVRSQELPGLFAEHSPQVVHFCGHGAGEQGLLFQDENGREQLVSTEILARLFKTFRDDINCVVLNACDSDQQSEAIVEYINYAVGMSQPILDKAAYYFATGFYQGLAAGKSIEQSYELGCVAIQLWSEGQSQSSPNRQYRKMEYAGGLAQPAQLNLPKHLPEHLPEHLKPILRKNKLLLASAAARSSQALPRAALPNLPSGFEEVVRQEIDRKEYKDQARAAYDNFGQFLAQNAVDLTKTEHEQRQIVLSKVKSFWIEGFLQPSLQGDVAIRLDLKARPGAIADLSQGTQGIEAQGIETLAVELDDSFEELQETRLYAEMGQGRTLLILGDPGTGKTIALLQLAQRLIERSEQNLSLPMPVVFNLSSWAEERPSIVDWLINELREKYQVPQSLSEPWIMQQQLILLLDGLDEVNEADRNECVRALNEFMGLFAQTEIAICSRVRDYEALTERLRISSALCLQPLSPKQVDQYLDRVGGSLVGLKALLKTDVTLAQFAQNPLILNFMSLAYQGWSAQELMPQLSSASERHHHLFETYIDRRLKRGATPDYSKAQVLHWLSWLASRMLQENQTIFLIEKMQPDWLQTNLQRILYRIGTILIGVLIIRVILLPKQILSLNSEEVNLGGVIVANAAMWGLALWWKFGRGRARIETFETLTFPWKKTRRDLLNGLTYGLSWSRFLAPIGIVWCRVTWDNPEEFSDYVNIVVFGLISGLILGLMIGLIRGLRGSEIETKTIPNHGIWRSGRNAGIVVVICWIILSLIIFSFPHGLQSGTSVISWGMILGLLFGGGIACIQHFTLRLILSVEGYIPWNYARFLNFASERLLMKKIGGGYVFSHRMLLEHFGSIASIAR